MRSHVQRHGGTCIEVTNYERLEPQKFMRAITGIYDVTGYVRPEGTEHVVLICWEAVR